jgi:outer membrane protein TolC
LAERQRARAGEESGLSARRFTLAEAEVRNALGETEAELARAEARARAWRPDLPAAAEPARLTSPEPPPPTEGSTPELRALEHEAEQAALDKKRAGRFLGFPTLQFGWQRLDDAGLVRSGPILAAGWTVPLFDRDHAERLETARRQEIAAARLELGRARVAGEIAGSAAAYQALFAAAREAGDALEDGERVTTAATAAYRAGEASLTDLLDCLRAALAARIGEIALRERVLEAHREVEAALGQPLSGGGW